MFVYKNWKQVGEGERFLCSGWFLFGFIPLVIWKRDVDLG